jgi:hypothetical protein
MAASYIKLPEIPPSQQQSVEKLKNEYKVNPFKMPTDIEVFSSRENDRKLKREVKTLFYTGEEANQ